MATAIDNITKEKVDQMLTKLTGMTPHSCSCSSCVSMCKKSPCLGTPLDMFKIAEAGFEKRISRTIWLTGAQYGIPPITLIAPIYDTERGCCTFFTDDNKCSLHDLGLKPTEGRFASHEPQRVNILNGEMPFNFIIALMWQKMNL